jgi:hypothetical protein
MEEEKKERGQEEREEVEVKGERKGWRNEKSSGSKRGRI